VPQGIELYRDGEGTPYFSTMGGFIFGSVAVALGAGGSSSVVNSAFADGVPFYYAVNSSDALAPLNCSFAGTTLNYSAPDGFTGRLFYGIMS
jgi:hypothetical protein